MQPAGGMTELMNPISTDAMSRLFLEARTANGFLPTPVSDAQLEALYNVLKMGPTGANSGPARFVFVRSAQGKAKLLQTVSPGNVEKTTSAPVTVIVAYDLEFYEKLPKLMPHVDARSWYAGNDASIVATAKQSGTLGGAYLIMAARALGLDAGPMGGFNAAMVDDLFFTGTHWRANFLVNLGHIDASKTHPRLPRLDFSEACQLA